MASLFLSLVLQPAVSPKYPMKRYLESPRFFHMLPPLPDCIRGDRSSPWFTSARRSCCPARNPATNATAPHALLTATSIGVDTPGVLIALATAERSVAALGEEAVYALSKSLKLPEQPLSRYACIDRAQNKSTDSLSQIHKYTLQSAYRGEGGGGMPRECTS